VNGSSRKEEDLRLLWGPSCGPGLREFCKVKSDERQVLVSEATMDGLLVVSFYFRTDVEGLWQVCYELVAREELAPWWRELEREGG
jgi:hypothetical protein